MNKTISIGLAGFPFTIEEHAYNKLSYYLNALRATLEENEAEEVMNDIEIRIVEIFNDSIGKRSVINLEDVDKVISMIGTAEVIEQQEETYYSDTSSHKKYSGANRGKQLFRDPSKQKIAGVCAGLAHYIGMDVTLMRIIWTLLTIALFSAGGSGFIIILLYLFFWLVLPKAESASDFLKMQGKPINFDNLKEESSKIVHFANESGAKVGQFIEENKPIINKTGSSIFNLFRYVFGSFSALLGIIMIMGSAAVFGISWVGNNSIDIPSNIGFFLEDSKMKFAALGLAFLTMLIPGIIFILLAIKLLSPKTKTKFSGYIIGGLVFLWIGLLASLGLSAADFKNKYAGTNEEQENVSITTTNDTIFVDKKLVRIPSNYKSYWNDVFSDKKTIYDEDYPRLNVERVANATPYLEITKSADGYNLPLQMKVPVQVIGNKILLPNYIIYPYANRLRDYDVHYKLIVPESTKVISLDKNNLSIYDEAEENNYNNQDFEIEDDSPLKIQSDSNEIIINEDQIIINGKTYESKDNTDSILINGIKVPKKEANKIIKENLKNIEKTEKVDINIKDGKKEFSIKTN